MSATDPTVTQPHPVTGEPEPVCVCGRRQSMHAPDGGCSRFVPASALQSPTLTPVALDATAAPGGPDPAALDPVSALLSTTDARAWAEDFCRRFAVCHLDDPIGTTCADGVGLMLGWFANAIETGRAAGRDTGPIVDQLRENLRRCVASLDDLVRYCDDPGTEALSALSCARGLLGWTPPRRTGTGPWPASIDAVHIGRQRDWSADDGPHLLGPETHQVLTNTQTVVAAGAPTVWCPGPMSASPSPGRRNPMTTTHIETGTEHPAIVFLRKAIADHPNIAPANADDVIGKCAADMTTDPEAWRVHLRRLLETTWLAMSALVTTGSSMEQAYAAALRHGAEAGIEVIGEELADLDRLDVVHQEAGEQREPLHIIRRADGGVLLGEYAFMVCDGPDDWTVPDADDPDDPTVYEILRCGPVVATRTFGEPDADEDDDLVPVPAPVTVAAGGCEVDAGDGA
jgi:hypothetical protein